MAKLTVAYAEGWPVMQPLGKKEQQFIHRNLAPGERVLGQVIGNFGQTIVATDHKVMVVKTGMMAGQTFGGKVTTFDYRNIAGVEERKGFAQGEFVLINPSMQATQGNRLKDKQAVNQSPNGVVFSSVNVKHFDAFAAKIREQVANVTAPTSAPAPQSIADQIRQLADLHSAGVLTDDEFNSKKAELLARM
jgi:hypothetical protein